MTRAAIPGGDFAERLLDLITTGVVTADRDQRVSFTNRMAAEILQVDPSRAVGLHLVEAFGNQAPLVATLDEVQDGDEKRIDFSWAPVGTTPLEMGMTILRAPAGAPVEMAFVLLFRDLGNIRQLEIEMRRVERLAALGKMMAGLAHEIRNPLTGVRCLAESLLHEIGGSDPRREYATRIEALVDRIERLIRSSLQFGEPRPADRRPASPDALVRSAIEEMSPRWHGGWPTVDMKPGLPWVAVDSHQVVECLIALIDNAVDAATSSTRVRVGVREELSPGLVEGHPRVVLISVSDDGPGIRPDEITRVFDPFFTTKAKGAGLGLSIAQALIRENGGRLLVHSEPGAGAKFTIVLPVPNR